METEFQLIPDKVKTLAQTIRRIFLKWSVQRPMLSMTFIIVTTVTLLPLVTAATLMPLALLLNYSGMLASQGILYVTYNILIQGLLLAAIIVALFIVTFAVATTLSVLHSYGIFSKFTVPRRRK